MFKGFFSGVVSTIMTFIGVFSSNELSVFFKNFLHDINTSVPVQVGLLCILGLLPIILYAKVLRRLPIRRLVKEIYTIERSFNFRKEKIDENLSILKPRPESSEVKNKFCDFQGRMWEFIIDENGEINKVKQWLFSLWGIKIDALEEDKDGTCLIGGIQTRRGYIVFA